VVQFRSDSGDNGLKFSLTTSPSSINLPQELTGVHIWILNHFIEVRYYKGTGSTLVNIRLEKPLNFEFDSQIHQIVTTYTPSTQTLKLYLDDEPPLIAVASVNEPIFYGPGSTIVLNKWIHQYTRRDVEYHRVANYNRVISQDEVNTIYNQIVEIIEKPIETISSLSFRTSVAIADLADGTYTTSDTLTYNGTTITAGSGGFTAGGVLLFPPGGYIIGTNVNGRKYITSVIGKSFGVFDVGTTDFTVAFVASGKGLGPGANRLTYGTSPRDGFNIHLSSRMIGFYPLDY
jgi:hypothetical protein